MSRLTKDDIVIGKLPVNRIDEILETGAKYIHMIFPYFEPDTFDTADLYDNIKLYEVDVKFEEEEFGKPVKGYDIENIRDRYKTIKKKNPNNKRYNNKPKRNYDDSYDDYTGR